MSVSKVSVKTVRQLSVKTVLVSVPVFSNVPSSIILSSPKNAWNVNEIKVKIQLFLTWVNDNFISWVLIAIFKYQNWKLLLRLSLALSFKICLFKLLCQLRSKEMRGIMVWACMGLLQSFCTMNSRNLCQNINVLRLGHATQHKQNIEPKLYTN